MWPFDRKRPVRALYMTDSELTELLQKQTRRIAALEDSVDTLSGQFARLRGYVYARKGRLNDFAAPGAGTDGPPSSGDRRAWLEHESRKRKLSKTELRELAGLVPLGSGAAPQQPAEDTQ